MREVDVSEGDQLAEVSSRARARARALVLTFSMVAKSVMEAERELQLHSPPLADVGTRSQETSMTMKSSPPKRIKKKNCTSKSENLLMMGVQVGYPRVCQRTRDCRECAAMLTWYIHTWRECARARTY